MVASLRNISARNVTIKPVPAPLFYVLDTFQPGTQFIADTFTAPDNTYLVNHTPNIGGAWIDANGSDPDQLIIVGNKLMRPAGGLGTGTAAAYSDTTITGSNITITFDITINSDDYASIELARLGNNYGNSDKFFYFEYISSSSCTLYGGAALSDSINLDNYFYPGDTLLVKINITSTTIIIYINGNEQINATTPADWFAGPLAVTMYDYAGLAAQSFDNLNVGATTSLANHVGEIGATWLTTNLIGNNWFPTGGNTLANIVVNPTGDITPDTYTQPLAYPSGSTVLNDTFTLELDFDFPDGGGPYTGFLGNLTTGESYVLNWFANSSAFEIDFYYLSGAGSTSNPDIYNYIYIPSLDGTGQHTLKIVCTPTIKYFFIDNLLQASFIDSQITSGIAYIYTQDMLSASFNRIEIVPGAVVPASANINLIMEIWGIVPTTSTLLNWPTQDWYFRVYENPIDSGNLGVATLVTISANPTSTIADFISQVEAQLPGFSCYLSDAGFSGEINLILTRINSLWAWEDGDASFNDGIWEYGAAFWTYTTSNGSSVSNQSNSSTVLCPGRTFTPLP